MTLICSRCGATFVCGAVAGLAACWCREKPKLSCGPPDLGASCYCPACLEQRLTDLKEQFVPAA
jgi:hypothetical protein